MYTHDKNVIVKRALIIIKRSLFNWYVKELLLTMFWRKKKLGNTSYMCKFILKVHPGLFNLHC